MKMAEKSASIAAFQKDGGAQGGGGGLSGGAEAAAATRNRVEAAAPAVAGGGKIGGGVAGGHEGGGEEDSAAVVVGNGQKAPSGGRDGDCGDISLLDKRRQGGSEEDEDGDDDDCGSEKMMVEEEDDGDPTKEFLRGDGDCGGGGALDAAASEGLGLGDEEAAGQGKLAEEESLDKDADLSQLGDDTAEAFEEPSGGRGRKTDDVISEEEEDDDDEEENSTSNPIENPKDANTNPSKDSTASLSELGPKNTIVRNNADVIAAKSPEQDEDEKPTTKSEENSSSSEETAAAHSKKKPEEASSRQIYGEIQENFVARDKLLGEIAELSSNGEGPSGMDSQIEQTMSEIRTLNELAVEKEREWNNIIYFKKMKEELLLRMQRRKRVLFLEHASNSNSNSSLLATKKAGGKSGGGKGHLHHHHHHHHHHHKNNGKQPSGIGVGGLVLNQNQQFRLDLNGIGVGSTGLGQQPTKQRPLLDVQSIIADYRQRHPETVPRRGRRIRNAHSSQEAGKGGGAGNGGGSILNFSSLALGSGAQVHHNVSNVEMDADIDGNQTENSRPSSAESATQEILEPSLKDMLAHIAKLEGSTSGGGDGGVGAIIKPPPPYPEVTVHPVPPTTSTPMPATNSLLHGILTKGPMKANTKTSFSPTLARLLTTPERGGGGGVGHGMTPTATVAPSVVMNSFGNANVSISEILSTNKARSEITITPVETQYEPPAKRKYVTPATQEEDEADAADRLVIDESNDIEGRGGSGGGSGGGGKSYAAASMEDNGDEVPQCQGCNQKSALFVCAGCGNQWYCSRECQVSAWDEHSEVCSG